MNYSFHLPGLRLLHLLLQNQLIKILLHVTTHDDDDDDMKGVGRLAGGILTNAHKPLSRCTDMLYIVVVIVLIIIVIIITSIMMCVVFNKQKKSKKIGSAEPYDDDEYDNDKNYEDWILWVIIQTLINLVNTIMAKYEVTFDLTFMTIYTRPL